MEEKLDIPQPTMQRIKAALKLRGGVEVPFGWSKEFDHLTIEQVSVLVNCEDRDKAVEAQNLIAKALDGQQTSVVCLACLMLVKNLLLEERAKATA